MFENSIKKHLKCDVDVGLFLSGGTDSTSIASVINKYHKKIRTFTYDFQNSDRGEGYIAKKIAKKLNFENLSYYLKPRDIENNIDKLTYVLESPFTSIRIIADHNLYKLCREKNVKVVLLGHGGDELLQDMITTICLIMLIRVSRIKIMIFWLILKITVIYKQANL